MHVKQIPGSFYDLNYSSLASSTRFFLPTVVFTRGDVVPQEWVVCDLKGVISLISSCSMLEPMWAINMTLAPQNWKVTCCSTVLLQTITLVFEYKY